MEIRTMWSDEYQGFKGYRKSLGMSTVSALPTLALLTHFLSYSILFIVHLYNCRHARALLLF